MRSASGMSSSVMGDALLQGIAGVRSQFADFHSPQVRTAPMASCAVVLLTQGVLRDGSILRCLNSASHNCNLNALRKEGLPEEQVALHVMEKVQVVANLRHTASQAISILWLR